MDIDVSGYNNAHQMERGLAPDETTSHSTWLSKDDSQAAGYSRTTRKSHPCRARIRLPADTVTQAYSMLYETPASPRMRSTAVSRIIPAVPLIY